MKDYYTVTNEIETKIEINRSVFISSLRGIKDFEDGKAFVKQISKRYSNATHNCYAIIGREEQKFSDDGEPQGTAGQPILKVLRAKNLENTACVVTRYFGGIKLGANGLVQAYTESTAESLKTANIVKMIYSKEYRVSLGYNDLSLLKSAVRDMNFQILDTQYADFVQITFAVPVDDVEKTVKLFNELTLGRAELIWISDKYIIY